jgi:hypothetical protein
MKHVHCDLQVFCQKLYFCNLEQFTKQNGLSKSINRFKNARDKFGMYQVFLDDWRSEVVGIRCRSTKDTNQIV